MKFGLWVPAGLNLAGVRNMAWFQNLTVVLKFLPLLFVAIVGWFFVKTALFPRFFSWADRKDTAWFGILLAAILPSLLMLWSYNTKTDLTVFTSLVDLTVVTVAIPYLMSACAQLTYLLSGRRRVDGWLLARDLGIAGAAALFSMWVTFAAGWAAVYQAMVLVLAAVIIYALVVAWRERTGQIPEPVDVAPADEGTAAVTAPAVTEPHRRHLRILGTGARHTGTGGTEAGP